MTQRWSIGHDKNSAQRGGTHDAEVACDHDKSCAQRGDTHDAEVACGHDKNDVYLNVDMAQQREYDAEVAYRP